MGQTITERLGAYVASLPGAPLDEAVTRKAVTFLMDGIGLALQARGERTCQAFLSTVVRAEPGPGAARLWQDATWASLPEGVTANSIAMHAHLQDDADMDSWGHPGSLIVPVAVGVAESVGASLHTTLRAIVAGYSVMQWLGRPIGRSMLDRGFRTSPTYGPVGAAASASVALGLDSEQASRAVAMAAAVAGGVTGTTRAGFADWRFQNASATWLGVSSARIAAAGGADPNPEIFEGTNGYLHKFAGLTPPVELPGAPSAESVLSVWSKPYPVGLQNVAVVAAALKLRESHSYDLDHIERIRVHQSASFAVQGGPSYRGPFHWPKQAIGSTPFAVSTALVYGPPRYEHLVAHLDDPSIMKCIERLEIVPEASFGYLDGRVSLETTSGDVCTGDTADVPATTFHRDQDTTGSVFDDILVAAGAEPGRGRSLSDSIFAAAVDGGDADIGSLLGEMISVS